MRINRFRRLALWHRCYTTPPKWWKNYFTVILSRRTRCTVILNEVKDPLKQELSCPTWSGISAESKKKQPSFSVQDYCLARGWQCGTCFEVEDCRVEHSFSSQRQWVVRCDVSHIKRRFLNSKWIGRWFFFIFPTSHKICFTFQNLFAIINAEWCNIISEPSGSGLS